MSAQYIEPQALKPTPVELEQAAKTTVKISIRGDTSYRLRFLASKLGVKRRLTYDQVIKLLIVSQDVGRALGYLRQHPAVIKILGE